MAGGGVTVQILGFTVQAPSRAVEYRAIEYASIPGYVALFPLSLLAVCDWSKLISRDACPRPRWKGSCRALISPALKHIKKRRKKIKHKGMKKFQLKISRCVSLKAVKRFVYWVHVFN